MPECGSISPHPNHNGDVCNQELGHLGHHVHAWPYGGGSFWTETQVQYERKLRVRVARWLLRDEPGFLE